MKTITLTAEEERWLWCQLWANACESYCVVHEETGHWPRDIEGDGCYHCRFTRAMESIEDKLEQAGK